MEQFFNPASAAFVGAPRETGSGADNPVEMALHHGYQGIIYPVNPRAVEICGLKAYPSVSDLPETPDTAVISVGRDRVLPVFQETLQKGTRHVIIISQGFADADEHGQELQEDLLRLAADAGARIVGPNTLGILNAFSGFSSSFIQIYRSPKPRPLSLISQTGVVQIGQGIFASKHAGKSIDLGNMSDVDFVDALEYFEKDPETKVIGAHMEGLKRGREFVETARRVTRSKPFVVLKTGRSQAGAEAVLSHTGSLVGEDAVVDAAFRRAGIIRADDTTELKDTLNALVKYPPVRSNKIGVISPSGGAGIIAADTCERVGLTIPPLADDLRRSLDANAPPWFQVGNPVDMWPVAIADDYFRVFRITIEHFLKDETIGGIVIGHLGSTSPLHRDFDCYTQLYPLLQELLVGEGSEKAVALWIYGDRAHEEMSLMENLPCVAGFPSMERAVRSIGAAYHHHRFASRTAEQQPESRAKVAASAVSKTPPAAGSIIAGQEALSLLNRYGIRVPESRMALSTEEARRAASDIGYPLVLKAVTSRWLHKTEHGGVITGINSREKLEEKFALLMERAGGEGLEGILLQQQVPGHELILGIKQDPQFGPIVICGTGGIYAEILQDTARELLPISEEQAQEMIRSLKGYPLLAGTRGEDPVDVDQITEAILSLSHLAREMPGIRELDINPLIVSPQSCQAVDARIIF